MPHQHSAPLFSIARLGFRCSRRHAVQDPRDVAARIDKITIEVSSRTASARTVLADEDGSDDSVVLRLARLIGRQIAREQFERQQKMNRQARAGKERP